jgi:hypothetical protein
VGSGFGKESSVGETYQDAYVFQRSTADIEPLLSGIEVEYKPFDLLTGSYNRLYVLKADTFSEMSGFLLSINDQDVNKALATDTPYRIVQYGPFAFMAFVQIWVRASQNPRDVLFRLSHYRTFKGGAVVRGDYDLLVEFGDDNDPAPVQTDADNVILDAGVGRRVIAVVA